MTHVIAEPCITVMDRACLEVCPVDSIREGTDMLYINPDECTDCAACVSACPVAAIFADADVPEQWKQYTDMNKDFFFLSDEEFAAKYGKPK